MATANLLQNWSDLTSTGNLTGWPEIYLPSPCNQPHRHRLVQLGPRS